MSDEAAFLESFARWAAGLGYEEIPGPVRQRVRFQLANLMAAAYGGYLHGGRSLTRPLTRRMGEGECSVLGGGTADPVDATFLHATWSMIHDYDDYLFMAHSGHGAVFAALATGELEGRSGRELITAVAIGNELAGRLGAATLLGPHNGQMWSFVHQAASAAVTARILDGGEEPIRNAVALALYDPPYPNLAGFMHGHAKYTTAGTPSAAGVRAGLLASGGAVGHPEVVTSESGFLNDFAYRPLPEMLGGLGETWVTRSLCYKPYPGCAYLQTPIEAYDRLSSRHDFGADEVSGIRVGGSLPTILMEDYSSSNAGSDRIFPTSVAFSVKLGLAVFLEYGRLNTAELTDANLRDRGTALAERADNVELDHDWDRTLNLIEGVNRGIDLGALVRQVGYVDLLGALRKVRRRHSGISTGRELVKLLVGGKGLKALRVTGSPLDWDRFDLAKASMDRVRFNFGCRLEVRLGDGTRHRLTLERHRGSTGSDASTLAELTEEKLRGEAGAYFDEESSVAELVDRVQSPENGTVPDLVEAFTGEGPSG